MKYSRLPALVAIAALALTATGCADGADSGGGDATGTQDTGASSYLDGLYEEAVAQGQTQILGYVPNALAFEPLLDQFYSEFPDMNVELVPLFGPELDTRLNAEIATGGIQADFTNVGVGELLTFTERGWLAPFVPDTSEGLPDDLIGPEQMWVTPQINIQGPIYNSNNLPADKVPSTWADVAGSELQGHVGNTPPTSAGGFPMATAEANRLGLIDTAWLDQLKAQQPAVYQTSAATVQAVVGGEIDLYTMGPYVTYFNAKSNGAPLEFVFLEEGNVAIPDPVALFANSPNQAGAKLFVAWLFTEEAQTLALELTGRQGTMPGSPQIEGLQNVHVVPIDTITNDYPAWRETLVEHLG